MRRLALVTAFSVLAVLGSTDGVAVAKASQPKLVTVPAGTWLYTKRSTRADRAKSDKPLTFRVIRRRGRWLEIQSLLSGDVPNYCGDQQSSLSQYRIRVFVLHRKTRPAKLSTKTTCSSRVGEKPSMALFWPGGRPAGGVYHGDAILTDFTMSKWTCFDVGITGGVDTKDNSFRACVRSRDFMRRNAARSRELDRLPGLRSARSGRPATGGWGSGGSIRGARTVPMSQLGVRRSARLLRFLPQKVDASPALSRRVADDYLVHAAYKIPRGDMLNINITFVRDLSYAKSSVAHAANKTRRSNGRGGYKVGTTVGGHPAAMRVQSGPYHQAKAEIEMLLGSRILVSVSIQVDDPKLLLRYASKLDIAGLRRAASTAPGK